MMVESADGAHALLGRSRGHRPGMLTCLSGFIDQAESIGGRSPFSYRLTLGLAKQSRSEIRFLCCSTKIIGDQICLLTAHGAPLMPSCRRSSSTRSCQSAVDIDSSAAVLPPTACSHAALGITSLAGTCKLSCCSMCHTSALVSLQQHPSSSAPGPPWSRRGGGAAGAGGGGPATWPCINFTSHDLRSKRVCMILQRRRCGGRCWRRRACESAP